MAFASAEDPWPSIASPLGETLGPSWAAGLGDARPARWPRPSAFAGQPKRPLRPSAAGGTASPVARRASASSSNGSACRAWALGDVGRRAAPLGDRQPVLVRPARRRACARFACQLLLGEVSVQLRSPWVCSTTTLCRAVRVGERTGPAPPSAVALVDVGLVGGLLDLRVAAGASALSASASCLALRGPRDRRRPARCAPGWATIAACGLARLLM